MDSWIRTIGPNLTKKKPRKDIIMKREEFFQILFRALPNYTDEDKAEVREYYEELICDGVDAGIEEDEVIAKLEAPEKIAESLLREYAGEKKTEEQRERIADNQNMFSSKSEIHKVVIGARDRGFQIGMSDDDKVHVYCERDEMDEIVCYENDGTFYFRQNNKKKMRFFFHSVQISSTIEVKLPKSVQTLEAATRNGGIHVKDVAISGLLKTETTNGGIHVKDVTAGTVEMNTTNGGVHVGDVKAQNITFTTSNGGIKVADIMAEERLAIITSNGSVQCDLIKGKIIEIRSSNAGVKGVIDGKMEDYAIESGTSNGKNTLPNHFQMQKEKKLYVSTSNGSIKISFSEK